MNVGCAVALLLALADFGRAATAAGGPGLDDRTWDDVRRDAQQFVRAESPPGSWPFERTDSLAGTTARKVIAHYFPPFPVSIDNEPTQRDYYARHYLRASGENGKFAAQGGYLRQRPLPTKVWPEHRARITNLAIEVLRAEAIGVDAFGVDLLEIGSGAHWATALALLDVAHAVSPTFRIVPEPDMASLTTAGVADLEEALATFFVHPASFHLSDGRLLVIPFLAENRPADFWKTLIQRMQQRGMPIALMPNLLDRTLAARYSSFSTGISFWGGRDASAAKRAAAFAKTFAKLDAPALMLPVAPQDFRPKDGLLWEARNSEAFRSQWKLAIDANVPYVHILTWNDYSESTEIAPSSGTQFYFYDLCAYYIEWFKRGKPPAVTRDALYYAHRRQIVNLRPSPPAAVLKLVGRTGLANDVEALAFAKSPGVLEIDLGDQQVRRSVGAGLSVHRLAAVPGRPRFRLLRDGRAVLAKLSDWNIDAMPERQDALYAGGSTQRPFVIVPSFAEPASPIDR